MARDQRASAPRGSLALVALAAHAGCSTQEAPSHAPGGDGASVSSTATTTGTTGAASSSDSAVSTARSVQDAEAPDAGAANDSAALPDASMSEGDAATDAETSDTSPSQDYTCNLLIGESPAGQWFDGGFLNDVDPTRWEAIWIAHHYTNLWANPADPGWGAPFDPYPGPAHTCAANAKEPDRVIFVAAQWTETTAAEWEADLSAIVSNIRTRYASVRRIELMALTAGPAGAPCPFVGPGTNETLIPAVGYQAIDAMPSKFPGLVVALPHFAVPTCADFVFTNGNTMPQYTASGAADVAHRVFGAYYKK